jgi:hypothetical protein
VIIEIALGIVLPVLILMILPELFLIAGLALLIFFATRRRTSTPEARAIRIIREYCVMNAYADTICDKRRDNRESADAANVTW